MSEISNEPQTNPKDQSINPFEGLPPGTKIKWTCSDHPTCHSCPYFYYSCHGLTNHKDPRVQIMPKNERKLLELIWVRLPCEKKAYLYWLRWQDLGVIHENLVAIQALTVDQIQQLLNSLTANIQAIRRKTNQPEVK